MTNIRSTPRPQVDKERLIRVALDNPELSWRQLGKRFGVSWYHVYSVLKESGTREKIMAKRKELGLDRGDRL